MYSPDQNIDHTFWRENLTYAAGRENVRQKLLQPASSKYVLLIYTSKFFSKIFTFASYIQPNSAPT